MAVEITDYENVLFECIEEEVKVGGVIWGAGWSGRDVDIDEFEVAIICADSEALVLYNGVTWEKEVCAEFIVLYRVGKRWGGGKGWEFWKKNFSRLSRECAKEHI